METINIYCLEKHRNRSGLIIEYIMSDEHGDKGSFDRQGVKQLIKDKKYNVVNLQLDRLGRVVDKAVQNEAKTIQDISTRSKASGIEAVFDKAYGFIQKMGMVMIVRDAAGHVKLTEPFDCLSGRENLDIDKLQVRFEEYVLAKYHTKLTKIDVTNTCDNSRFIQYGKEYVEYTILNTQDFKKIESNQNIKIKYNADKNEFKGKVKVDRIMNPKTGKVIDDAFLGIILYDKRNKQAADWAQKRMNEIEKKVARFKRGLKAG